MSTADSDGLTDGQRRAVRAAATYLVLADTAILGQLRACPLADHLGCAALTCGLDLWRDHVVRLLGDAFPACLAPEFGPRADPHGSAHDARGVGGPGRPDVAPDEEEMT